MDVGEAKIATGVAEGESFVIEAEQVEDGGVHIVHVDLVLDGVVAEVVGLAKAEAGFHAGTGQPLAEAARVVVAAGAVALSVGRAAKFAAPPDQCVLQKTALFEVMQQASNRFVHSEGVVLVLGHVGVLIPGRVVGVVGVIDLNEADAGFGKAAGHQALATEVVGEFFVDAVELLGGGGFGVDVESERRVGLESPGQLVGLDDSFDILIVTRDGSTLELRLMEGAEEIELAGAIRLGVGGVMEVLDFRLAGGLAGATKRSALVAGWEKGRAVVARTAIGKAGGECDKAGEVLVIGAEAVADPGAHARADEIGAAGVEEEGGGTMRNTFGVHAFNDAEVIHVLGHMWEELRGPEARLAALFEIPERFHDAHGSAFAGLGHGAGVIEVEGDPVVLDELGFVIEGIDMRDTTGHENEDHALRAGSVVGEENLRFGI